MTFTEKLDILMQENGISSRQKLADETSIPYTTIMGFYAKGYKNIKLSNLRRLSEYFGVSMDILGNDDVSLYSPKEIAQQFPEKKYSALSKKERNFIDNMIDGLLDMKHSDEDIIPEPIYIREYVTPAAAGYASPAEGEDYILVPREDSVPKAADFAVRIAGDSMEPYIEDGSRVYVSRTTELTDGDIGIFFVDGDMKCKQYCEDSFGNIYLFSLNRDRKDADMTILASSGITVFCFGKVLMKKRPPLPKN